MIVMYKVYVLYNSKHNKIYIGQTKDLEERIQMHERVEFPRGYTSRFDGSWRVIYTEDCENRELALKREKQLKSFKGRESVKKYIPA